MLTGLFHQLRRASLSVDVHNHKEAALADNANNLTRGGDLSENLIRLNNKPGNGGTH